jgi:DNA-binding FadR family transcriptional regulator
MKLPKASKILIDENPKFQIVRSEKFSQQISRQLLEAIVSGRYPPGAQLPSERELTEMFKASRIAVREALSSLVARGIANVAQGRGTTVNPMEQWNALDPQVLMLMKGEEAFDQLAVMRRIIEPELAALAAERITPESLETLRGLSDLPEGDTSEQHVLRDTEFHLEIARSTQNAVLLVVLLSVDELLRDSRRRTFSVPGEMEKARKWHRLIFAAIESHDPERARKTMRDHVEQVRVALNAFDLRQRRDGK